MEGVSGLLWSWNVLSCKPLSEGRFSPRQFGFALIGTTEPQETRGPVEPGKYISYCLS